MSCQNCQKLNWNCVIILQVMVGGGGVTIFPALAKRAKGRVDIFRTCCQGGLHIFITFKFIFHPPSPPAKQ